MTEPRTAAGKVLRETADRFWDVDTDDLRTSIVAIEDEARSLAEAQRDMAYAHREYWKRTSDAALARVAELERERAAIREWLWRHAGHAHSIGAFAYHDRWSELGFLACQACDPTDDLDLSATAKPSPDATLTPSVAPQWGQRKCACGQPFGHPYP